MSATLATDGMTKAQKAERAAALMRRAGLAGREGNRALARSLRERAESLTPEVASQLIKLPDAQTIEQVYGLLGFGPAPHGDGWIEVDGIYRRLNAAATSIRRWGFYDRQITMGFEGADGFRPFLWESEGGRWTRRHWRVTGKIRYCQGKVLVIGVTIAVKSSAKAAEDRVEWTAFRGRALNRLVAERLTEVLAVIGARALVYGKIPAQLPRGVVFDNLTERERDSYHDLHPSPMAAFVVGGRGRLVLWDDDDSAGSLEGEGVKTLFIELAFRAYKPESFDGDVPLSDR